MRVAILLMLVAIGAAFGRAYVGVSSAPAIRLAGDLDVFSVHCELGFNNYFSSYDVGDHDTTRASLRLQPWLGVQFPLRGEKLVFYVAANGGTVLSFDENGYVREPNFAVYGGAGLEYFFTEKLSVAGEYLLGFYHHTYPGAGDQSDSRMYGLAQAPSVQLRFYFGKRRDFASQLRDEQAP